jgi:hypothetical protein
LQSIVIKETEQRHVLEEAQFLQLLVHYRVETILLQEVLVVNELVRDLKDQNNNGIGTKDEGPTHTSFEEGLGLLTG